MTAKMPNVLFCNVNECAYNEHDNCHAGAITVDRPEPEPMCDTFFRNTTKGGMHDLNAQVGACKNDRCTHNHEFECTADAIRVSLHADIPACDTYDAR